MELLQHLKMDNDITDIIKISAKKTTPRTTCS